MNRKKVFTCIILLSVLFCGCEKGDVAIAGESDLSGNFIDVAQNIEADGNYMADLIESGTSDNVSLNDIEELPRYNEYINSMKSIETDFEIVQFGSYEQDGVIENGTESIDWYILDEKDDKVMLISKYALDYQQFNDTDERVTWENSSLREWLNDDFYNAAFDEAEQELICDTNVENPDNHWNGIEGGNDTIDKVYILSFDEICQYFTICWQYGGYDDEWMTIMSQNALCTPTDYVAIVNDIDWQNLFESACFEEGDYKDYGFSDEALGVMGVELWCRTPGYDNNEFVYSSAQHFSCSSASGVISTGLFGIRPVIWVDKSVINGV